MKKFSDISTVEIPKSEIGIDAAELESYKVLNESNQDDEFDDTLEPSFEFPPYMIEDPTFVGYPNLDLQNRIYYSSIFGAVSPNTKSILDVGCGRGDFGNFVKNIYPDISYTGIDLNQLMIDAGKFKYSNQLNDSFKLVVDNFDAGTQYDDKFDWVFHITNLTVDYANFNGRDRYEYLQSIIMNSLNICNEGVVFMLLNESNELDAHITHSFDAVARILYRLGYKFAFDNTDFSNVYKLIIFNNKF